MIAIFKYSSIRDLRIYKQYNVKFSRVWNIGFNQIYPEGGKGIVYHVSKYSKINGELMRDGQWLFSWIIMFPEGKRMAKPKDPFKLYSIK